MNSKMTTNSQLPTNEPKNIKEKQQKQKLSKQLEQKQSQRNGQLLSFASGYSVVPLPFFEETFCPH